MRFLLHDRDTQFPASVDVAFASENGEAILTPYRAPNAKGYVERLMKSYQGACILRDEPTTEEAAREVTEAFLAHDHDERPRPAARPG
jgi:hypothetical protein